MNIEPISIADWEALARQRLSETAWMFYSSGADDAVTLRQNRAAFERVALHYRVLVGVDQIDTSCRVLGEALPFPVLIAPTACQALAHPDAEVATARGASTAGTILVLSTLSNRAVEEVTAATERSVWFQLYVYRDRTLTEQLIERVEAAGCRALVLTVDAPVLTREANVRNRFPLPPGLTLENLLPASSGPPRLDSGLAGFFADNFDSSLTWDDLAWLRRSTRLPVIVKGIVRPDDARRAVDAGVAAIIVSNHGGRQLDSAPATIDVLPSIANAVGDQVELYMDGGIRRGVDVIKAIARGARAVLLGRPILWGLAADGERGVAGVLAGLRDELERSMALCGCPSLAEIGPDLLGRSS